ncbi:MAG: TIGR03905 family TSCPD domain-containing protein [Clostridiales bacterium]|nr:TIGR03905 family TSCPD domain-containing protein [Clostridiales bacterium]
MTTFKTAGTCASEIVFDIDKDTIKSVTFNGGCPGNAIGLSGLLKGMKIDEAIKKMQGIKCGSKDTSCPDQLSLALDAWRKQQA